jgi:hypothetical protein
MILCFILFYVIKGIIWILIDKHLFKTEYTNNKIILNILIWPFFSIKQTINKLIK